MVEVTVGIIHKLRPREFICDAFDHAGPVFIQRYGPDLTSLSCAACGAPWPTALEFWKEPNEMIDMKTLNWRAEVFRSIKGKPMPPYGKDGFKWK